MADENIITNDEEVVQEEQDITSDLRVKYITPDAFQTLLDDNTVNQNCVYIVHYNDLPTEISETPVLEVFIGSSRVSSIINLDTLPEIFDTKYINSSILKERVEEIIAASTDKNDLAEKLNNLIIELEALEPSNNSTSIPTNLGLSNKLYLYFNRGGGTELPSYEMFVFNSQLRRFIPLRLIPADSGTPTPTPPPTPTPTTKTTKLILEYSSIITQPQVSQLNITGQEFYFDLQSMTTIKYGRPGNNIFVQGKMAFWSFDDIARYIEQESPTCDFITYNNCFLNFSMEGNLYTTYFHSDFNTLEYKTYTDHDVEKEDFFIKTVNKYYTYTVSGSSITIDSEITNLTKDCWDMPNNTSWTNNNNMSGYGIYGITILINSVKSPGEDPTRFPYGYVIGRIYNTITGKRGCTDIDDYIDLITGDTSIEYDSYLYAKIPFASLNEYYYAMSILTKSEVVIIDE